MKGLVLALAAAGSIAGRPPAAAEPIRSYDLSWTLKLDRRDPAALRRIWDATHLVAALQGLANREAPRLYVRYLDADDFWLRILREEEGWPAGREVAEAKTIDELLEAFRGSCRGTVVWDERVPATSDVASTVAGADDLLPLRHDPAGLFGSLAGRPGLEPKIWLVRPDGGALFTGSGKIPGTDLPSRGSAKADAYAWAVERYLKTGKSNPAEMAYYIDGYWLRSPFACETAQHTLANHDWFIARRAFFFDLLPWDDEVPVDDPGQPPGTDVRALKEILLEAWRRRGGRSMLHIGGFVPWAFKYTDHPGAGGRHGGVPTEWRYSEIISCFDGFMDADAIGLAAMANASFFRHFPAKDRYPQPRRPGPADLRARGLLGEDGRVAPAAYVAFYAGDWDSAAWVYRRMPQVWADPARGRVPIGWAVNPNLEERIRPALAWMRRTATPRDVFIAGDSGAGYLNPGYLEEPRPHSGLPAGLDLWARHCEPYYRRWDLTVTGFVIDGYARGLSEKGFAAYARFSPGGIVPQKCAPVAVRAGMPVLRAGGDLGGSPDAAARQVAERTRGRRPSFHVFRSILQTPSWHLRVAEEAAKADPGIRLVDPHELFALVKIHEEGRAARERAAAGLREARLGAGAGPGRIAAVGCADGACRAEVIGGVRAAAVDGGPAGRYLYLDVPDGFLPAAGGRVEVAVTYLDRGRGTAVLEYDSTDPGAPLGGAYKAAGTFDLAGGGAWREARFALPDARFAGSQNGGADLRLAAPPAGLAVREVVVRKTAAPEPR